MKCGGSECTVTEWKDHYGEVERGARESLLTERCVTGAIHYHRRKLHFTFKMPSENTKSGNVG